MLKWFLLILFLYIGAVLVTAGSGDNQSEKAWGFILGGMLYAFVYGFALIPAFLLVLNKNRRSTILYALVLLICAFGMFVAGLYSAAMDGSISIFVSMAAPFLCIFCRAIFIWYVGYEADNWDGF